LKQAAKKEEIEGSTSKKALKQSAKKEEI